MSLYYVFVAKLLFQRRLMEYGCNRRKLIASMSSFGSRNFESRWFGFAVLGIRVGGFDYALSGIADVAARSPDSFRTSPNALRRCRPRSQSVGTDKSPCAHADSNGPHSGPNYIRAGPNHKNLSDVGHQLTGGGVKV